MANRVTGSEVKEIFQTTLTASEVEVFITPANQLVTEKLAASGLSDDRLKEIERWLAAHLLAVRDPRKRRQQIGDRERERLFVQRPVRGPGAARARQHADGRAASPDR